MSKKTIAIFGTSKAEPCSQIYKLAFETGELLAQAGFDIANGGYGGTMEAAAKGASNAGAQTIGVTCTAFKRSQANKYITRQITTDSLQERLNTLIELADAYVVLPGSTGTLLELAAVWELKNKNFIKNEKPIILVGEFWQQLVNLILTQDAQSGECIVFASAPEETKNLLVEKLNTK